MINAWVNGYATKNKDAHFSVMIESDEHKLDRTYKIGDYTINQSELIGTRFVMEAIKDHSDKVCIHTSSKYVIDMLERDDNGWKKNAISNKELVDPLRELFLTFMNIQFVFDKDSEKMLEVNLNAREKQ